MLYYNFKNYTEFKERFSITKHENGTASRKNKIILAYLKNKELLHKVVVTGNRNFLKVDNMTELMIRLTYQISNQGNESLPYLLRLNGMNYYSSIYSTDKYDGICEDGDTKSIRYVNNTNNRVFKMKAGKLFRSIVLETEIGKSLSDSVINFLCEEFTGEWKAYVMGKIPEYKLYVNRDFERIYSSANCIGDFGSCMTDRGLHYFYTEAVKASAAYLENTEGKIIARCIIYDQVRDQDSKIWRLAERQYSSDGNEIYKRLLIDELIKGEYIDGYKTITAGCGDARAFIGIKGESLEDRKFEIDCSLYDDSDLSYQDSFKWYDRDYDIATNYGKGDINLDTTEGTLEPREYDSYHDEYVREISIVYVGGVEHYCDTERLGDFVWIKELEEYHHEDDVIDCDCCNKHVLKENADYSDITEEYYCSSNCMEKAEKAYKVEHWYYSDYDGTYYEDADEVLDYHAWNEESSCYETKTIHYETFCNLVDSGYYHEFDNQKYDSINPETHLPYGFQLTPIAV